MSITPKGWTQAHLGEVAAIVMGQAPPGTASNVDGQGTIFVKAGEFGPRYPVVREWTTQPLRFAKKGDVLICVVGATAGKLNLGIDCAIGRSVAAIRPSAALRQEMLYYQLLPKVQDLRSSSTGSAQGVISSAQLADIPVDIPPAFEQVRIAKKLDVLTERIDACRVRLNRVSQILKRFREAVLEAAVTGRLTEEWRAERGIPSEWPKAKLAEIGELGRGKSKHRPRNDPLLYGGPYPFIQTGDVARSNGKIAHHAQTYSTLGLAQSRLWPAGTLCITIAANIADTGILSYPACFPDSVVGFVGDPGRCSPWFIKWSIDVRRDDLESFAPATAQKNINLAVLADIELELPSLAEQLEIVRRVDKIFAFYDDLERRYQATVSRVEKLTPAVLTKAFRGALVPQDPKDEPADKLLERARASRQASVGLPRAKRKAPAKPRNLVAS